MTAENFSGKIHPRRLLITSDLQVSRFKFRNLRIFHGFPADWLSIIFRLDKYYFCSRRRRRLAAVPFLIGQEIKYISYILNCIVEKVSSSCLGKIRLILYYSGISQNKMVIFKFQ